MFIGGKAFCRPYGFFKNGIRKINQKYEAFRNWTHEDTVMSGLLPIFLEFMYTWIRIVVLYRCFKLHHIYILDFCCSILYQDKANKRWMLMSIDRRKKLLKYLRSSRFDAFEMVCAELGITYTFPPEYYRRATRRWLAKKALCIKVTH